MQVGNLNLVEFGNIYPIDEEAHAEIQLDKLIKGDWTATLVAIMEHIIKYNTQIVQQKSKAYRIFYYVRNALHIFTPDYEWMDPSKTMLVLSTDGIQSYREKCLEVLAIKDILGIGSDLFTMPLFNEYQEHEYGSRTEAQDYRDAILNKRANWNKSRASVEMSIKNFLKDLNEINTMNSYNRAEFYNAKREYIADFMKYLEYMMKNPSDESISKEDLTKIYKYYNDKYEVYDKTTIVDNVPNTHKVR